MLFKFYSNVIMLLFWVKTGYLVSKITIIKQNVAIYNKVPNNIKRLRKKE